MEPRSRLHIVVGCSSRKARPPLFSISTVRASRIQARAIAWWNLLTSGSNNAARDAFVPAAHLYNGNYWSIVRQLSIEAKLRGFESHLWIVSAGYGLVTESDLLLPYSATFTKGDTDWIATGAQENDASVQWWKELSGFSLPDSDNPRSLSQLLDAYSADYFLVVISADYVSAIQPDLIDGVRRSKPNLVLISSRSEQLASELEPYYIATDARLLCAPNCSSPCDIHLLGRSVRGSIGVALAREVLKRVDEWGFSPESIRRNVESWLARSPELFKHDRLLVGDDSVREFIESELKLTSKVSATGLLRTYRNRGFACEQKRFRHLFQQVKGEVYEG